VSTYHVILADRQFLVTETVKKLISDSNSLTLIAHCTNFKDLTQCLNTHCPQLLITDYHLFDYDSFEHLKKTKDLNRSLQILILTQSVTRFDVNELARIGIKNILLKSADADEFYRAVEYTLQGKVYYSPGVMEVLIDMTKPQSSMPENTALTASEIEIVRLIARGMTTKEIASKKNISFHTVMSHRKNIFRKVNVTNVSELIRYAMRSGLIDDIEYYI
jgi:DNA-binding NarL/FixJ family response regulator